MPVLRGIQPATVAEGTNQADAELRRGLRRRHRDPLQFFGTGSTLLRLDEVAVHGPSFCLLCALQRTERSVRLGIAHTRFAIPRIARACQTKSNRRVASTMKKVGVTRPAMHCCHTLRGVAVRLAVRACRDGRMPATHEELSDIPTTVVCSTWLFRSKSSPLGLRPPRRGSAGGGPHCTGFKDSQPACGGLSLRGFSRLPSTARPWAAGLRRHGAACAGGAGKKKPPRHRCRGGLHPDPCRAVSRAGRSARTSDFPARCSWPSGGSACCRRAVP